MVWPVLIVATLLSVFIAIACFAFGLRKLQYIVPTQVIVSFGVTYAVAVQWLHDMQGAEWELAWTCLLAAIFVPAIWLVLRLIIGPLQRQRATAVRARS